MSSIQDGQNQSVVLTALGKPDDVVRPSEIMEGFLPQIKEIWCYGTNGHLGLPTLGSLFVNEDGLVDLYQKRNQPDPILQEFQEEDLRHLLRKVDATPPPNAENYYPRRLVKVTNQLHPLGKQRILTVLKEYLRIAPYYDIRDARQGIFLLLRVLFETPSLRGYFPNMEIGQPDFPVPNDPTVIPRFPLVLQGDVPLLVIGGYRIFGFPEPAERHVEIFDREFNLRKRVLCPTNRPFEIIGEVEKSPVWGLYRGFEDSGRVLLMTQMLRFVDSVYRPQLSRSLYELTTQEHYELMERWQREFSELNVSWDMEANDYMFQNK